MMRHKWFIRTKPPRWAGGVVKIGDTVYHVYDDGSFRHTPAARAAKLARKRKGVTAR